MTAILTQPEAVDWRTVAGADSPAGPLFSTEYAEGDLTLHILDGHRLLAGHRID